MPYKKEYHPYICRFMEFQYGFSVEFDSRSRATTFTRQELLDIWPNDILRFMALMAYGDPDYNIHPPVNHRPTNSRSSTLEATKRALSYCWKMCASTTMVSLKFYFKIHYNK